MKKRHLSKKNPLKIKSKTKQKIRKKRVNLKAKPTKKRPLKIKNPKRVSQKNLNPKLLLS
ncbi:MAG: hypothetical protein BGO77_06705 [Caedibacter sp. 37-49]|nr:MAG: hypothetical protein BGO77_06705 [Caedibacter sp. 37-49]